MQIDIRDEINHARKFGGIYCDIIEVEPLPLSQLAPRFEFLFIPDTYHEINKAQAETVAKRVLHRDLAYDAEIMTETEAQTLANRFTACFDEQDAQYYTNGYYYVFTRAILNKPSILTSKLLENAIAGFAA